jgi:integrase
MKSGCLSDGFIEYIQGKTKEGNPKTIRVPVNIVGMKIYEKYKNYGCETIFPFPSQQEYNRGIKKALRIAGINRIVTIINQTTRQEEKVLICDLVSSHMARRTFMGNTYKRVKDKTMVASLTGHSPNSRAFNRYVEVDDDMKREMVKLIE